MSGPYSDVVWQSLNGYLRVSPNAAVVVKNAGTSTVAASTTADANGNWTVTLAVSGFYDIFITALTGQAGSLLNRWLQIDAGGTALAVIDGGSHVARASADQFFTSSPFPAATSAAAERPLPFAGTVNALSASVTPALTTGEQIVLDLMKNGASTGLTATLSSSTQQSNVGGGVAFALGDRYAIRAQRSGPLVGVVSGSSTGSNASANGVNISVSGLTSPGPAAGERIAIVAIAAFDASTALGVLEPTAVTHASFAAMTKLAATQLIVGGKTLRLSLWYILNPPVTLTTFTMGSAFTTHPREYATAACILLQGAASITSSGSSTAAGGSVGVTLTPTVANAIMVDAVVGNGNINLVGATSQTEIAEVGTTNHLAIGVRLTPNTSPLLSTWTQAAGTQMVMVSAMVAPTTGYVPGTDVATSLKFS